MYKQVTVCGHKIKVSHRWQKIQISVTASPTSRVVEGIQWSETVKMMLVLFDDCISYGFVNLRSFLSEKFPEKKTGKKIIAFLI